MLEDGQKENNSYSKNQKLAVGFLVFFCVFAVILWTVQMKSRIGKPFALAPLTVEDMKIGQNDQAFLDQMIADSDKDGLPDADELSIYQTSPYLEDSDSDGHADKQEIESGNDPNCPSGQICAGKSEFVNQQQFSPASTTLSSAPAAGTALLSQSLLSGEINVSSLRQMLLSSGMNKEALDKISDADLMSAYQKTLNSPK